MEQATTPSTIDRDSFGLKASNYLGLSSKLGQRVGQRLLPCLIVLVTCLVLNAIRTRIAAKLGNDGFFTGYSLAAIVTCLLVLGVRKRVVRAKWGRTAIWQRSHHYLGMLSLGAYSLHADFITTGWLESALAISFWAIAISGLLSWYINKSAPRILMAAGPQILRQDIPEQRNRISHDAYTLALQAAGRSDAAALADHYQKHLSPFLSSRRSLLFRIRPTGTPRRRLLLDLENLDRYLDADGRVQRQAMSLLVQAKDDLDFQSAIQNRIRLWSGIHTWLLGGFVVLAVAHVLIAHQFSGSW